MPRSTGSQDTSRIQFAYRTYVNSPMGDVFQYLLHSTARSAHKGKKMGLAAMSAFWKPFSARSVLELSEPEVRAVALASIAELQQQISLIRKTFNIPENLNEMTRKEIEKMIEKRLSVQFRATQKHTAPLAPMPDNYNTYR